MHFPGKSDQHSTQDNSGRVVVIATGGTIAATADASGARVPTLTGAELVARTGTHVATQVIDTASLDSSSMTLADIDVLANYARRALKDPATLGVVITHGTDSMAETALALDLMLDDDRPIVLTGAQLPADHPETDGTENLSRAIDIAASPADISGVVIHFGGRTLPARGAFKRHTSDFDAFAPVTETPLARPQPVGVHRLAGLRVAIAAAWPGAEKSVVSSLLKTRPDGIVVAGLGSGNMSSEMGAALADAMGLGIPVVISTQVPYGEVSFDYGGAGGGSTLGNLGAISANYLKPGQARLALIVALASKTDPARLLA